MVMVVIDASALLELLLSTMRSPLVVQRLSAPDTTLHAPHLIDLEVTQTLRRFLRLKTLGASTAQKVLDELQVYPIKRYAHRELLPRIWRLRDSISSYDASYVALAEALDAPLLTCDAKLAAAHGHGAKIELV
jgi:predicted nucleic acid-binding protein